MSTSIIDDSGKNNNGKSTKLISGFTNKSNLRDYQIFTPGYYSGGDVSIFFGDIWVDEVSMIAYQMQEKVMPLYGYADYTYSKALKGNRLVQGQFQINFTEARYLYSIVDKISSSPSVKDINNIANYNEHRESHTPINYTIDGMSLSDYADKQENLIWGEYESYKDTSSRAGNEPKLSKNSFDIMITFGPYTGDNSIASAKGFNSSKSTFMIIKDVTLTGVSMQVDTSDNPISEMYSFIARDIVQL